MGSTNLLDIAWIPATGPSGQETLTLHETLTRSAELTRLGPAGSPTEMDALMRFLIPIAALVLREADTVHDETAVEAVLDRHRARFELFDRDRPLFQEWHVTATERDAVTKPLRMDALHVHAPGPRTALWCLREDQSDPTDLSVLPVLLLAAWYERANSNTAAPPFYDGIRVSALGLGARIHDGWLDRTSFYLAGETVADTLALNVPLDWLDTTDLPVWLDQDATPSPEQIATGKVPVWVYTWSPNRALILTGPDGAPTGWVSGLTRRGVPEMGKGKKNAREVVGTDHHALLATSTDSKGIETTKRVRLKGDLTGTQGLEHWYREELGARVSEMHAERHLEHVHATRVAAFVDWRGDKNDPRHAAWVEASLRLLTIPPSDARDALIKIVMTCTGCNLSKALGTALGVDPEKDQSMLEVARASLYTVMDRVVLPALGDLAAGRPVDLRRIVPDAIRFSTRCFERVTQPLITPTTVADVSIARHQYTDSIRTDLAVLTNKEETA